MSMGWTYSTTLMNSMRKTYSTMNQMRNADFFFSRKIWMKNTTPHPSTYPSIPYTSLLAYSLPSCDPVILLSKWQPRVIFLSDKLFEFADTGQRMMR
jgi:hypothetical protein